MKQPRDPKRIDVMLDKVREYWRRSPDMRLGQLVTNAAILHRPHERCTWTFMIEDDVLEAHIDEMLAEMDRQK